MQEVGVARECTVGPISDGPAGRLQVPYAIRHTTPHKTPAHRRSDADPTSHQRPCRLPSEAVTLQSRLRRRDRAAPRLCHDTRATPQSSLAATGQHRTATNERAPKDSMYDRDVWCTFVGNQPPQSLAHRSTMADPGSADVLRSRRSGSKVPVVSGNHPGFGRKAVVPGPGCRPRSSPCDSVTYVNVTVNVNVNMHVARGGVWPAAHQPLSRGAPSHASSRRPTGRHRRACVGIAFNQTTCSMQNCARLHGAWTERAQRATSKITCPRT